jgi:hypothetical protein
MHLRWHQAELGVDQAWATNSGEQTGYIFRVARTHLGARLEITEAHRGNTPAPVRVAVHVTADIEFTKSPLEDRAELIALLKREADHWLGHLCPQLRRSA